MSLSRQKLIGASPILNLILPTFLHFGTQSHRYFVTTFSCSVINLRRVPYTSAKSNCSAPPNMLRFPCLCSSFFFCLQFPISELCPCKSALKQSSRISSSTSLPEKISRVSVNTPKKAGGAHWALVIPMVGGLNILWMIMKETTLVTNAYMSLVTSCALECSLHAWREVFKYIHSVSSSQSLSLLLTPC